MLKTVSSIVNAIGALNYKGTWDASANTPTLASGVGTKGDYYQVSVAGSTTLDGISNWGVGDVAAFNGTTWQRIEGGADLNGVNLTFTGTSSGPAYQLSAAGVVTESGATRTLSASDNGKVIYCTSGSAVTITCATGLGAGFSCTIIQGGAGKVTVAPGAATLVSYSSLFSTMGQYAVISAVSPVADTFLLAGNLGV
jgi:hypothetical protein